MPAYGYIRKSVVHDPTKTLSPEMQEAAIRTLAARNGDEDVTILSDLDVSGKKGRDRRRGWDELLSAVEGGEATAVYAYSLSRFARSVAQLADFFELCDGRKVPVRVERDHIDTATATGKLVSNVLASLAQFESDVASERVKDAFAAKRGRDPEWLGPGNRPYGDQPGEDVVAVVEAFRQAGSFVGAAKLLRDKGTPTRKARGMWHPTTVRDIVRRVAPDELLPGTTRGAAAGRREFRLAGLLECGVCGRRLTGSRDSRSLMVRYQCHAGAIDERHGRGWVSESVLLPAVAAEMSRALPIVKRRQVGNAADEARLAELAAKRARIVDMAADGVIDKADRDRRLAEVAQAESVLTARRWVRRIGLAQDVERGEPSRVNAWLRGHLNRVTVDMASEARRGPQKAPPSLTFEWRDPSLRIDGPIEDDAA